MNLAWHDLKRSGFFLFLDILLGDLVVSSKINMRKPKFSLIHRAVLLGSVLFYKDVFWEKCCSMVSRSGSFRKVL